MAKILQKDRLDEDGYLKTVEVNRLSSVKLEDFMQVYLKDISGLLRIKSNTELNVLVYFWKYSNFYEENQIGNMVVLNSLIVKKIAGECKIHEQSVRNAISSLKRKRLLIPDDRCRGVYYLNAKYFFKGKITDRMKLIKNVLIYQIVDKDEQVSLTMVEGKDNYDRRVFQDHESEFMSRVGDEY